MTFSCRSHLSRCRWLKTTASVVVWQLHLPLVQWLISLNWITGGAKLPNHWPWAYVPACARHGSFRLHDRAPCMHTHSWLCTGNENNRKALGRGHAWPAETHFVSSAASCVEVKHAGQWGFFVQEIVDRHPPRDRWGKRNPFGIIWTRAPSIPAVGDAGNVPWKKPFWREKWGSSRRAGQRGTRARLRNTPSKD